MRVFDEVIIINDTEFYKKGERGHIVKVIDENNAVIYTYRMRYGRVEEIVNKNNFEVIKGPKISHDFSYYFDYLKIKVTKAEYGEIIFDKYGGLYYEQYRKPTSAERREIVINFLKRFNGDYITIDSIAKLLGVKTRTIQYLIKDLESKGYIKRTKPELGEGKVGYKIEYIKDDIEIKPSDLTIEHLYDIDNPAGIRDYNWEEFKVIPYMYDENFTRSDAARQVYVLREIQESLERKRKEFRNRK